MKSTGWRLSLAFVATAGLALGAVACTKSAESKSLSADERAELANKLARPASQRQPTTLAPTPVVAPEAPGTTTVEKVAATTAPETADTKALTKTPKTISKRVVKKRGGLATTKDDKAAQKAAEPVAKPVPKGKGISISNEWYSLRVSVPSGVTAGGSGTVKVTLVPKPGWKINLEFPTKLVVVPPAGVTVAKAKQKKKDATSFSEKKATFNVDFKASDSGSKHFTGKFKFAVCTDTTCDPKTEQLAFSVSVL